MLSVCLSLFHQNCSSQDSANIHIGIRRSHLEMIDFSNEDDLSNVNVKSLVSKLRRNVLLKTFVLIKNFTSTNLQ
jgi:hypothetical protein